MAIKTMSPRCVVEHLYVIKNILARVISICIGFSLYVLSL